MVNPILDACLINYSAWPSRSRTIVNTGSGGSTYNGAAVRNQYWKLPTKATSFTNEVTTDAVTIPFNATNFKTNAAHTIEIIVRPDRNTDWQLLFSKGIVAGTEAYGADIRLDGSLVFWQYDTAGVAYREWLTPAGSVSKDYNFIQITWDGAIGSDPRITINNVLQTLTAVHNGITTAFFDSNSQNATLGNGAVHTTSATIGSIVLFRWHNRVLSPGECTQNYQSDEWRFGAPKPIQKPAVQPTHSYDFNQSGSQNVRNTARVAADPQEKGCVLKYDFNQATATNIQNAIRPQPYETGCLVKWDFNQSGTGAVTNAITPGTYDLARSVPGTQVAMASAAYKAIEATNSDWHATTGTAINNLSKQTIEFVLFTGTLADADYNCIYSKNKTLVAINGTDIYIKRFAAGGTAGYIQYTVTLPFIANSYYHVVITWDGRYTNRVGSPHPTYKPKVYINGAAVTVTDNNLNGGAKWDSDSAYNPYLFTSFAGSPTHVGYGRGLALFRLYNKILSPDQVRNNFLAEQWRCGGLVNSGGVGTADVDSNYFLLDGTDVLTGDTGAWNVPATKFTIEWVGKITAAIGGNQWLVSKVSDAGYGWLLYYDDTANRFTVMSSNPTWGSGGYTIISTKTYPLNTVNHVTFVYDGTGYGEVTLYVNGAIDYHWKGTIGSPGPTILTSTALKLGSASNPIRENLYLVRLFDTLLTQSDVTQNYVAEKWRYAGLTNVGAVSTPGLNSYYYNFDGADYLAAGSPAVLPDAFSIEFEVACTIDAGWRGPVGDWGTNNGWAVIRHPTALYYYFAVYNAGVSIFSHATTKTNFVSGQVYHFVFTYDKNGGANNAKWYIDGVLDHQATIGAIAVTTDASALQVGRYSVGGGNWLGGIYLARIYNKVLSAAEAAKTYLSEKWRTYVTKTDEYVEITPPTYRVWARNYDYTLRNPVTTWLTLDAQLIYCDVSTVVMTMDTADFLAGWFDSVYTPATEGTWIQNRIARVADGAPFAYPARRFLKGTGLVIWRNADETPCFSGVISGFKERRVVGGEDTCEVTFSSDEILLQEHIAFPDEAVAEVETGQRLPDTNGIWGHAFDNNKGGEQWGTTYRELEDAQEAQMKYFVQDQIGIDAPATTVTNRKLSVLKTQACWNYTQALREGYGDKTLLTDILDTLLDLCKFCVVPQPAVGSPAEALVPSPQDEVQFFVRYLYPPDGAYYLEFRTQTATNAAQRLAMPPRWTGGTEPPAGYHEDLGMGEHDKRLTCVFSEFTGTVTEVTYEELRPEMNQCFVIGPTPNADTYITDTPVAGANWIDAVTNVNFQSQSTQTYRTNTEFSADNSTTVADTTTSIDHRLYKLVSGKPVILSQDVYGVVEGTHEHSTGEATTKARTLNMMQYSGRAMLNEKLSNIYFEATITENTILTLSPDDGPQNFWLGDYVKVVTKNGTLENLVRSVDLSIDSNGEVMKCVVGAPAAAYGNWWTANVKAKEIHHQHSRSRCAHYHRTD